MKNNHNPEIQKVIIANDKPLVPPRTNYSTFLQFPPLGETSGFVKPVTGYDRKPLTKISNLKPTSENL